MTDFVKLTDQTALELAEGIRAYPLFGERTMLNLVDLEPGAAVALHRHPHEQLGLVLRGEVTMTVAGVDHRCCENDAYRIAGGIEHGARAGAEGARVLDIFAPVREDYRELAGA